jgi:hypothetical protein
VKKLLEHFNATLGGEDIFKPTIGNGSSNEVNNDDGFSEVNLPRP